ncbi:MAG: hypothetical protein HWE22_15210 [Flavobacteriales bacterium]|nr:hypothetical protein [Flavobacteriales bacterium]
MTSGLDFTELPSKLWNFVLESISLRLTHKVKSDSTPSDSQIWTIIPNEEREWIEIDQLKGSVFSKKKQDFVGLDFNKNEPILGSGKFWIDILNDAKEKDLTLNTRNIYIMDIKMDFFLFYIENSGLLVYGKDKSIMLRK